jgi:hypothetical protein
MTKEDHAKSIITTVADYMLAQRVKKELFKDDAEYREALVAHHLLMQAAMKTKQVVDVAACDVLDHAIADVGVMYTVPGKPLAPKPKYLSERLGGVNDGGGEGGDARLSAGHNPKALCAVSARWPGALRHNPVGPFVDRAHTRTIDTVTAGLGGARGPSSAQHVWPSHVFRVAARSALTFEVVSS